MNPLYSTYNYNARLDRISIDRRSEPIKKEATLRLSKQTIPTSNASAAQPSTDQHLMEVHVDGRLLARWDLSQLTRRASGAIPGLIAHSFSSFRLERIIQLVLPLPMPEEEDRLPSGSQTNPDHLKIIRFHLNTHQEFHTVIRYLSKDAGFHHQETLGLRSLSAMSLSNGRVSGSNGALRPLIRPSDRSPGLIPKSGSFGEAPPQTGPSALALDHDTQGNYEPRSQTSTTPWDTSTWPSGVFAHSSLLQARPATAQPYQRFSKQNFRRDQPSRMESRQRQETTQWFPDRQMGINGLDRAASHHKAGFTAATNRAFHSSGVGLRNEATEMPRCGQNLATNQENLHDFSLDSRASDWQSTEDMAALQDIDPPDKGQDMPPPTKVIKHTAHLQSKRVGTDDLWTQTPGKGLVSDFLSQAPKIEHPFRLSSDSNSHAVSERMPLMGRSDLSNITPAALQKTHRPVAPSTAENGGKLAGDKRPASRQSVSHSTVKKPRRTPGSVNGPGVTRRVTTSQNQTNIGPRASMAIQSAGPEFTDAEGAGPELAEATCMRCRRTHTKCDRLFPACGSCVKAGRVCTYPRSVKKLALDDQEREILQNPEQSSIGRSHQEEARVVPTDGSSILRQPQMQKVIDYSQGQARRRYVAMIDAGTSPEIVFSDSATQTSKPTRLHMGLSQWTNFMKSAVEMQQDGIDVAARSIEKAGRTSPEIRSTLLEVGRAGLNIAQDLRELYRASLNHPEWQ